MPRLAVPCFSHSSSSITVQQVSSRNSHHGKAQVSDLATPDFLTDTHCLRICREFARQGSCRFRSCKFSHNVAEAKRTKKSNPPPSKSQNRNSPAAKGTFEFGGRISHRTYTTAACWANFWGGFSLTQGDSLTKAMVFSKTSSGHCHKREGSNGSRSSSSVISISSHLLPTLPSLKQRFFHFWKS